MNFLSIHTFTNTWVIARDGWHEDEVGSVSIRQLERIMLVTSCHCLSNQKCHWGVYEAMATTTSKISRPCTPLLYPNIALDAGYVSEDRRRQAKRFIRQIMMIWDPLGLRLKTSMRGKKVKAEGDGIPL